MSRPKTIISKQRLPFRFRYHVVPVFLFTALLVFCVSYFSVRSEANCGCTNTGSQLGEYSPSEKTAYFLNQPVGLPLAGVIDYSSRVLGDQTGAAEDKWIEVDLSDQILRAWQGGTMYLETLVSTGKWNRTPTGEFRIWSKFKYTKMSGGSKEKNTYYYLPNVPFTMYFNGSYGIHGTYWHNNFGTPMSHGCINMPTPMAEKLFYWASPELPQGKNSWIAQKGEYGTRVVIHE